MGSGSTSGNSNPVNLLREEIALPAAVIHRARLDHNIAWMQQFADAHGVQLAPHGKTTMTPAIFHRQVAAGAWGLTLATPAQARVAAEAGATRVLMANQLVGQQNFADVSKLLQEFPTLEFFCLVDSLENIQQLGQFFSTHEQSLSVLLEYGVAGGRTGCRGGDDARQLCDAIKRWPSLKLAGVETYEGLIHGPGADGESTETRVHQHLESVRDLCVSLIQENRFDTEQVILSGAGSAWYDLVCDIFTDHDEPRILPVIRPGCYVTHDGGIYQQAQAAVMARLHQSRHSDCCPAGDLQSCLEVWAYVQSVPEPGLAILAFGKRDAAYDAGLPVPQTHFRPGRDQSPQSVPAEWELTAIMDQHAMLRVPPNADIKVGDILALGTSHPCLTFDKWRQILLIDDAFNVVETAETFF